MSSLQRSPLVAGLLSQNTPPLSSVGRAPSFESLEAKVAFLERENDHHRLEKAQWDNERAVMRHELNEAKRVEQQAREDLQRRTSELQRATTGESERTMLERERVQRQYQMVADDAQRQLNESEVANSRLSARVAQLQREMQTKDEELTHALRESSIVKQGAERMVQELVDKQRRTEEDAQHHLRDAQEEIQMLLEEHRRQAADLAELRRQLAVSKEELIGFEAQVENAKSVNQQLLREIDHLHRQSDGIEQQNKELERAERAEQDAHADLDVALAKLAKAEDHIRRISGESASSHVDLLRLRHQVEIAEDGASVAKRERTEVVVRLAQLVEGVVTEAEQVQLEVDQACEGLHALINVGVTAALGKELPPRRQTLPIRGAENAVGGTQPETEQSLLATMVRIRDALSVAKEDVLFLHRGIVEEAMIKRDGARREKVVDEMLKAERAHIVELSSRGADLEARLKTEEAKSAELERSLLESSNWMNEAVSVGEERTRRMNSVLEERRLVAEKLAVAHQQLEQAKRMQHEKEVEQQHLLLELEEAKSQLRHRQNSVMTAEDDVASLRHALSALRSEVEGANRSVEMARAEASSAKQRISSLETEIAFLRKQADDIQAKAKLKDQQTEQLERQNHSLKDQLFAAQNRLDQALRATATGAAARSPIAEAAGPSTAFDQPTQRALQYGSNARGLSPIRASSQRPDALPPRPFSAASASASLTGLGPGDANDSLTGDRVKQWETRIQSILMRTTSSTS